MFATKLRRIRSLSQPKERTQKVLTAIKKQQNNTAGSHFRPGDINQILRDGGFPMGNWEVRRELSELEHGGLLALDVDSGCWSLTEAGVSADG